MNYLICPFCKEKLRHVSSTYTEHFCLKLNSTYEFYSSAMQYFTHTFIFYDKWVARYVQNINNKNEIEYAFFFSDRYISKITQIFTLEDFDDFDPKQFIENLLLFQ